MLFFTELSSIKRQNADQNKKNTPIRFCFMSKEGCSMFYRRGFEKESYIICRLRESFYKGQDGK